MKLKKDKDGKYIKPDWWPDNPYPESIFIMTDKEYAKVLLEPKMKTAVSGYLGRFFWNNCQKKIWELLCEEQEEVKT